MGDPTPTAKRERDFHALRLSDGRSGQRGIDGVNELAHSELQADLGQHPPSRRQAAVGRAPHLQVEGIPRLSERTPSARALNFPRAERSAMQRQSVNQIVLLSCAEGRPGCTAPTARGGCAEALSRDLVDIVEGVVPLPVARSAGWTLASDLVAAAPLPPFDQSAGRRVRHLR